MSDDIPDDTTRINGTVVRIPDECAVCEDEFVFGGWRIVHGETTCANCGSIYQIRPLSEDTWEDVPRHKNKEEYVEPVREFYQETGKNVMRETEAFTEFLEENYPDLA